MHDFDMNTLPEDACTDQSDFFSEGDAIKSCHNTPTADRDQECNGAAKKLRLSHEQSALLEQSFNELGTLNPKQKNALAKQLKMRPRQVEVWFQNRRARTKLKQTEVECEYLKRCCDSLTEENKRLEREIRELRAFKMIYPNSIIDHHFHTSSLPAATLTMCPSCQRLSAPHSSTPGIGSKPTCCLGDFTQSPRD